MSTRGMVFEVFFTKNWASVLSISLKSVNALLAFCSDKREKHVASETG